MTTKQAIFLKDYTTPDFNISQAVLDINLADDVTTVTAKLSISGTAGKPLVLAGEKLVLKSVKINGSSVTDYKVDAESLTINQVPAQFELETVVEIKPQENTALSGLYKSNNMYCTQCEAHGFRRITYYLDRPDVMAKFIVTVRADKNQYPVLLVNGNLVAQGNDGATRHFATWEDPFKKPCYLFALVAGDLVALEDHFVTMNNRLVTLKLFIERENIDQSAYAMQALKKAMQWDEQAYGREYDLDIYMIVAVNDFNMGAMENKGLNIFNSKYILVSPYTATDSDYEGVDMVVGHEYFHNWSGNRVTCRDWFQLSLKEGFTVFREQQFTQDITQSPVARIENARQIMTSQFAEDAGPLAHPVRPDSYVEINNFYTMTIYEKGSEVIRMMYTLLGPKLFRAGTDLYFAKFDGQAVTTDDFALAMQEASGIDLSQFKLWYTQAGTPEVTVTEQYDAKSKNYILTLQQNIPDTPGQTAKQPMLIPVSVGLLDEKGKDLIDTQVLSLTQNEQTFEFTNINVPPKLSILRDFSAPVKLNYDQKPDDIAFLFAYDSDNFNRWYAGQRLYESAIIDHKNQDLLLASIGDILRDNDLNLDMKAELLRLPTFAQLVNKKALADPQELYADRKKLLLTLTGKYLQTISDLYKKYNVAQKYSFNPKDAARRALKNLLLQFMASTKSKDAIALAKQQYLTANNMTDSIAALSALVSIDCEERTALLADFYAKWSSNPLVVNKWLSIQTMSDLPDVLENVKALMQHVAFSIKNPNNVYALIGAYCGANPASFHAKSGTGYKFLADVVLQLDTINPQVAAKMLGPLTRWQRYSKHYQDLMLQELRRISAIKSLSPDAFEIVSKSLC